MAAVVVLKSSGSFFADGLRRAAALLPCMAMTVAISASGVVVTVCAVCRNEGTAHALALLVHGDAAMAGLGIVTEAMQMSELEAYWVRAAPLFCLTTSACASCNQW